MKFNSFYRSLKLFEQLPILEAILGYNSNCGREEWRLLGCYAVWLL
jgi:hypothetical protein